MNVHTTKDQRQFVIRRPSEADAERLIQYSKILFASTDQVLTVLDEYTITVEEEEKFISNLNRNPNALLLVAEINNQMVGFLFFIPNAKKKNAHTGEFGVNVHPDFQGIGIGQALVEALLAWAKTNAQIEKVFLNVFASNWKAIKLYKNLGFVEEGRHVKAIKQLNGDYVDVIQMYVLS